MGLRLLEGARGFAVPHVTPFRCSRCQLLSIRTTRCAADGESTAAVTAAAGAALAGKHYVVVGAGLAGLATAFHLLKQSSSHAPVHVTVYDAVGIGAGGSGAAAGLLHPFTPTGKLLWRAEEAMEAALELLAAAEAAAEQDPGMLKAATDIKQSQSLWKLYGAQQQQHQRQLLVQRSTNQTQLLTTAQQVKSILSGAVVSADTAQQLVPGLQLPDVAAPVQQPSAPTDLQGGADSIDSGSDVQQQLRQRRRKQAVAEPHEVPQPGPPAGWSAERSAALHVQGGITLQPQHYMQALWSACQQVAAARQDGSSAQLVIQQLQSLSDILAPLNTVSTQQLHSTQQQQQAQRRIDGIVVAAGAAVGSLAEIGQQLPLRLCQGYTLDMVPPVADSSTRQPPVAPCAPASGDSQRCQQVPTAAVAAAAVYPADGPSLLGTPYLASQGGQMLVVGATKQWDFTTEQALAELGRSIDPSILSAHQQRQQEQEQQHGQSTQQPQQQEQQQGADEAAEVAAAADELIEGAAAVWPGVRSWSIAGVRTGVRAMQQRSQQGVMPIAGKWMDLAVEELQQQQQQQEQGGVTSFNNRRAPVWLLVGLGARGLVYHAWLGKLMADAVLSNSEGHLPTELLGWRQHSASTGSMSTANHV